MFPFLYRGCTGQRLRWCPSLDDEIIGVLESGCNKLNASKQEGWVYSFVHIGSKEEILAPHPSCFYVVTAQEATAYGVPLYHFVRP